ncbi:MAG: hypothetical protein ACXW2E_00890 [Nitrososphaeraceae archaeon]
MTTIKSPFYIVEDFISPLHCEELIEICDFTVPDSDVDGKYVKTMKSSEQAESMIYERLQQLIPKIQEYYSIQYKGTESMVFEWFPEGAGGEIGAENSVFLRGKWLRTKHRDFTGILFLCDHQDSPSFEQEFEVYGGKLEFPQHAFGFNPQRGTLVIFPSDPHFINVTARVFVSDLFQVRIQIAAKEPYIYDPQQFPGNYTSWFK